MKRATQNDEETVIRILTESFDQNKSVNFIIKQDRKRKKRIKFLMKYSFFIGMNFGEVFLGEDKLSCCIVIDSKKNKNTFKKLIFDIRLVRNAIGFFRIKKILKREKILRRHQPNEPFFHLWYIGVLPQYFGKGKGSVLLKEVLAYYEPFKKNICLETSMVENMKFYHRHGFDQVSKIDQELAYELFIFKHEFAK